MSMCSHEPCAKASTDPNIHKMAILADVAPYSREYNTYRQIVGKEAQNNTELEIEYEKILKRVKQTRESVIKMTDRHFTAPVDEISGTIEEASPHGITLKEYPGRRFQFSSVSTSAADMSARILGDHQVFPSCRTQKLSRARDRWSPVHHHDQRLSILAHTKTLAQARQAEASSSDPSFFPALSSSRVSYQAQVVSSSCGAR
jgi:hypothetical protein